MPAFRIGFGSDFTLANQLVGVGTTSATRKLDVDGVLKGDFNVSGASTLTVYGGFVGQKQNISVASTIVFSTSGVGTFVQVTESETGYLSLVGEYNTVSEDIIVDEGKIFEVSVGSTVSPGTLESVSIQSHFSVPDGGTNERPDQPVEGMVRFNDDLNTLEFYNGIEWRQFTVSGASGRGVFTGGYASNSQRMEYINISTQGNSINFGELFESSSFAAGKVSDGKRGVIAGGRTSPANSFNGTMQYYTFASGGNSIDFGNQSVNRRRVDSVSSSTRGVIAGGSNSSGTSQDVIDYIEIQTLGNALDFGNLSDSRYSPAGICNSTRGLFCGGGSTDAEQRIIDFITISSKGDAVDFGECTQRSNCQGGGFSNGTRGVLAGGYGTIGAPQFIEQIEQINIASTGNSFDFGILHQITRDFSGAQNMTRAVLATGGDGPAYIKNITQISLTTSGTSEDFGDLSYATLSTSGGSDSHGGLGGF